MKPTKNESLLNRQCQYYILFLTMKNGFWKVVGSDSA